MNKIFKRFSAVVLAFAVVVTAIVFDVPWNITAKAATVGGCDGKHSGWTEFTADVASETYVADGKFFLNEDITLNRTIYMIIQQNVNVTLCLNGHTINANGKAGIFRINEGGSLTLCDCKNGQGKLTGGIGASGSGGAVYVAGGTFTMHGGTITGNTVTPPGWGDSCGGGVYVSSGTFTMNGGTISDNTANSGSGGGVYVNSNCTFTMNGGTISGNTASDCSSNNGGGGVYINKDAQFIMNGGTISGNKASSRYGDSCGGGVFFYRGTFTINGKVDISGNTLIDDGSANNVCFNTDNDEAITIGSNFSTASTIGVTTKSPLTSCDGLAFVTETSKDVSGGFTADNNGWSVFYDSGSGRVRLMGPHSTEKIPSVAPTCTATGLTEGEKCSNCGTITVEQTTIDAKGHKEVADPAVAATCTTAGKTAGSHCSVCNTVITAQTTVAATGHKWGNWTITKEPTLTAAGTAKHICDNNSSHTETPTIPKLTDTSVWKKDASKSKPATEESTGEDVYISEYGEVKVTVDKLGHTHNWSDWNITKEPNFSETGTAERVCAKDNSHTETAVVPVLTDPLWTKTETPKPTIDTDGEYTYESEYGEIKKTVPPLSDTSFWTKEETKKPAVDENGEYTYKNDDYGEVKETVPKLSDTSVWTKNENKSTEPSEEKDGKDVYESKYGTVEVTLDQLDHVHVWGDWKITTAPTISTDGEATRVCQKFSSHTETAVVPKLTDPSWTKTETQKPTISETGTYTYTSTDYGTVTATVPKLTDPSWTKTKTKKPTIDTDGEFTYESDYGKVTVDVPKLSNETVWKKTETKKPTVDENGEYTYESGYGKETVDVPKLSDETVWTKDNSKHVEPKEDEDGKDVYKSEYGEAEEILLATGSISKQVKSNGNAPAAKFPEPGSVLADAVLTEADKSSVENDGATIKILLVVDDASNSVSAADKTAVETAVGGLKNYKQGQYLDVNLFKVINGEQNPITETKAELTITIEVPPALRGSGRTYSVIRVHNGETTVLNDQDSDPNTVTIKTDKFSTYALAYQEGPAPVTPSTPSGNGSGDRPSRPSTSDNDSSTSDESTHNPSESNRSKDNDNPATGIAISRVPLVAALAFVTMTIKRKRK